MKKSDPPSRKPTFISLFSGCGGFDLGFLKAGFQSIGAFEIDGDAVMTYRKNVCEIITQEIADAWLLQNKSALDKKLESFI